jgi:DNA-directed RNA polymerase subunit delta
MDKVIRKISYLRGLADGLNLEQTDQGRILKQLIEVMDDLTVEIKDTKQQYAELEEYVEAIDEDLNEVELDLYEDVEIVDYEDDDEDDIEAYDDDDIGYFDVECPNCQELVAIDHDIFDNEDIAEVLCPECHDVILISEDDEDDVIFDLDDDFDDEEDYTVGWSGTGYQMEENMDEPRVYY